MSGRQDFWSGEVWWQIKETDCTKLVWDIWRGKGCCTVSRVIKSGCGDVECKIWKARDFQFHFGVWTELYIERCNVNRQPWGGAVCTENVESDRNVGGSEKRHDWTTKKNRTRNKHCFNAWRGGFVDNERLNIKVGIVYKERRDSSVGIATRYGLDGPGIESRCGGRDFPQTSSLSLRPTQPPIQWVPGLYRV